MQNEITIAVCVYNSEKYIAQTLACISRQTFQAFDLLIINDCSTDNTKEVIESFFQKTKRTYKLINLQQNKGIANARQTALEKSTSKYVLFIDSDDFPHKDLLEKEYRLILSDENIMAVSCWSEYVDIDGDKLKGGLFMGAKSKDEFMGMAKAGKLIFLPIQTLFNREFALQVGGFRLNGFAEEKPRYSDFCEDLDLWTRMSDLYTENKYMISIPEVLYSYRKSNIGLSSNTIIMFLKIRYVKTNLKLRRAGSAELSFTDFFKALSEKEMMKITRNAKGVDCLRNGVFLLLRGRFFAGSCNIVKAIFFNPKYFVQKLKLNSNILK